MMKITRIERASKGKAVYNIYAEDLLLFSVTEDTLVHFGLQKGMELSEKLQEEIFAHDQLQRCLHQAYRYLSRRNHFQAELRRKLKAKGFSAEIITRTLEVLQEKGYLNTESLISQFISDAINLKKYGPLLIIKKLAERGIAPAQSEDELNRLYPIEKQLEVATRLAEKKWASFSPTVNFSKRRQKLSAFLQQRGFTFEVIQEILQPLSAEQIEDEGDQSA